MAGGDPLMAAFLGAFAAYRRRPVAERAVVADLDRVGVGDNQHRVRRACPCRRSPRRLATAMTAAIDDDPLAPLAQLERQEAGMGMIVETVRRRASGIDDDQA